MVVKNINHSSLTGKRTHTKAIHGLDKVTDVEFVKKLKTKYGTWILSEYDSDEEPF